MTMPVPATRQTLPQPYARGQEHPLRGLPSTAAVLGHPIHPMLVPFPLAFLVGALATDLAASATRDPFWSRASAWLLGAGAVTGVLAGAVGSIDYLHGPPRARARDRARSTPTATGWRWSSPPPTCCSAATRTAPPRPRPPSPSRP